jgi:hypothetical protein
MGKEIDWREYERRKHRISGIGLTCAEYSSAIARITADLEWEADLPARLCPKCRSSALAFVPGGYVCKGCEGRFVHSELLEVGEE